jgi:cytochrome c oxidase assembly protein subunit 15
MAQHAADKWLKALAAISAVGMFLVNLVGFLDTQTDSALGCGRDWPLCNGAVIPQLSNEHVDIEFAHRVIVGGFALLTIVVAVWAWRRYRQSPFVKGFAGLAIGFIVIQSALGALAVLFVNPTWVLALHLGFGMLSMIGTELLALMIWWDPERALAIPRPAAAQPLRRWFWAIWIYTFVAIYWGSYVAFRNAGQACPSWPLCGANGWGFPVGTLAWFDAIHRLLAAGLAVLVVVVLVRLYRLTQATGHLKVGTWLLTIFVASQIASGAYLVFSRLATGPYLLHVANLMVLFGIESYLVLVTWPEQQIQSQSQAPSDAEMRPARSH